MTDTTNKGPSPITKRFNQIGKTQIEIQVLERIAELESKLAKSEEALGAIMKIMKRGQAYDVAKQALAELKERE